MSKKVPEGWKLMRIGNLFNITGGDSAPQDEKVFSHKGIPFIRMKTLGAVHQTNNLSNFNEYIQPEIAQKLNMRLFQTGTIILPRSGSVYMNHRAILGCPAYIVGHLAALIAKDYNVDIRYVYYYLCKLNLVPFSTKTTGLDSISFTELKKVPLLLPPLPEQRKIATILLSVDNAIEKTKAVIEQTKIVKKGLMQELLTKGIPGRHKKFKKTPIGMIPEDWEVVRLEKICEKIQDGTHFSPKSKTGPRMYITSKNIRMGYIELYNVSFISEEEHAGIYKRCDVKLGDILLTKDGAQAGNLAINTIKEEVSLLSSVALIRPDKSKVSSEYIFQFYSSDYGQTIISNEISGQAITRLTLDKIKRLNIFLPHILEQVMITDILNFIDKNDAMNKNILGKLTLLKSALMQVLLTGEVRVKI